MATKVKDEKRRQFLRRMRDNHVISQFNSYQEKEIDRKPEWAKSFFSLIFNIHSFNGKFLNYLVWKIDERSSWLSKYIIPKLYIYEIWFSSHRTIVGSLLCATLCPLSPTQVYAFIPL